MKAGKQEDSRDMGRRPGHRMTASILPGYSIQVEGLPGYRMTAVACMISSNGAPLDTA